MRPALGICLFVICLFVICLFVICLFGICLFVEVKLVFVCWYLFVCSRETCQK